MKEQFTTAPKIIKASKLSETLVLREVARVRDYNGSDLIACGLDKNLDDHIDPSIYGNSWLPCKYEDDDLKVWIMNKWHFVQSIDWEFKHIESNGLFQK